MKDKATLYALLACLVALFGAVDRVFGFTDRWVRRDMYDANSVSVQRQVQGVEEDLGQIRQDIRDIKQTQVEILKAIRNR